MVTEISVSVVSEETEGERQPLLGPLEETSRGRLSSDSRRFGLSSKSISVRFDVTEGTSWPIAALILTNVIMGVGLLNFPRTFADAGDLYWALLAEMICIVFIVFGLVMLGQCAEKSGRDTLQDLIEFYTGTKGLAVCNFCILLHNFGTCVTLLIIIADQFDGVMQTSFGSKFCFYWFLDRTFTLPVLSLVLILPLCFMKNIASFSCSSIIGVLTVGYLVFIVVWYYFNPQKDQKQVEISASILSSGSWFNVFKMVPTICFSFEAHIEAVPLFYTVRAPRLRFFTFAVAAAVALSAVIYTVVGVLGVLSFGPLVAADMLTNYSPSHPLVVAAMVMLAVKAIMTYPIILFCARLVVDGVVVSISHDRWTESRRRYVITSVLFVASVVLAGLVPSIGSVISLLGFTGAIFVFVFPGVCYVVEYSHWIAPRLVTRGLLGALFLVMGALVAGISTTQSVQRLLAGEFAEREVSCSAS